MTNHKRLRWIGVATVGVALTTVGGAWWLNRPSSKDDRSRAHTGAADKRLKRAPVAGNTRLAALSKPIPPGWVKARAQVADTMQASPDRLSPYAALEPFDERSFERHPEEYLAAIEPARCFQVATHGPGVPRLEPVGSLRTQVAWGDSVELKVRTLPRAPVTFTAFGGGYFTENGVGTVSVRADAKGDASAHYTADSGIVGDTSVVAGSPVASGEQRFFIGVGAPAQE